MATLTRRQRLQNILASFGHQTVSYHAAQLMYRGLSNYERIPDDALEMLTKEVIRGWRLHKKIERENRERRKVSA